MSSGERQSTCDALAVSLTTSPDIYADCEAWEDHARSLETSRDELAALLAQVMQAFPDLAEYERGDGESLAPLAARIQQALGRAERG